MGFLVCFGGDFVELFYYCIQQQMLKKQQMCVLWTGSFKYILRKIQHMKEIKLEINVFGLPHIFCDMIYQFFALLVLIW